jgi:hypothetical protein
MDPLLAFVVNNITSPDRKKTPADPRNNIAKNGSLCFLSD